MSNPLKYSGPKPMRPAPTRGRVIPADLEAKILDAKQKVSGVYPFPDSFLFDKTRPDAYAPFRRVTCPSS